MQRFTAERAEIAEKDSTLLSAVSAVSAVRPYFFTRLRRTLQTNLLDELPRLQREDRIAEAKLLDAARVFDLRKLPSQVAISQGADFVLVEIADEIAHEPRRRALGGPHAVPKQMLEHIRPIAKAFRLIHRASL
jgi:hypothetical protein